MQYPLSNRWRTTAAADQQTSRRNITQVPYLLSTAVCCSQVRAIRLTNSMFEEMLHQQDIEVISRLIAALLPRIPVSPRLLKESSMLVQVRKAVLESGDWLTAAQVSELAGLSTGNTSTQPNKWKKQGKIFAVHHNGVDYYPSYGLDPENSFRPNKDLATIIAIFSGHKKYWGMAYWFLSANSFLGGKRPQDLLRTRPKQVIKAAIDEVQAIAHS